MRYIVVVGFLLNIYIIPSEPSNRTERRQTAKTGMYRRK